MWISSFISITDIFPLSPSFDFMSGFTLQLTKDFAIFVLRSLFISGSMVHHTKFYGNLQQFGNEITANLSHNLAVT